jgi:hypothetical protein
MIKAIKQFWKKRKQRQTVKGYVKQLEKDPVYYLTAEQAVEQLTIERVTYDFTVDVPEEAIESVIGDYKASFVTYNGVPYNKHS